ncbi:MAG: PHP domain-containing protein [Candidatus Gastranaerophilales bacterium]|nr:PHP domain-containing protein [Candidatus Gastranaerophilales bacterium]
MVHLYPGAIHIHTVHSDGTGTVEEVAKAAKEAGLAWIVITDHNNMDAQEGDYNGVTVIVGEEISPDDSNHYIALDIKENISPDMSPKEFIQEVKNQGGFGFIAHPDESVDRKNSYPPLRWTDWGMKGFGGIEIWNYMSDWVDYYNADIPQEAIKALLFRNNILTGPTTQTMKWWDRLNTETPEIIPAIGGVDVHAMEFQKGPFKVHIFPYKSTFDTVTNFLHFDNPLPVDFEGRKKAILNALKKGHNLIANRVWTKKSKYPIFYAQNGYQKAFSGGALQLDDYTKLMVKLPQKAEIKLIYEGQLVWHTETDNLEFDKLDHGKYRIEAYFQGKPWIFSNPILLQ